MSKLYAVIENEQGKRASKAGNEYLDIEIRAGNSTIARLTVREGENGQVHVFDEQDEIVNSTPYKGSERESKDDEARENKAKCAYCHEPLYGMVRVHHHTEIADGIEKDVTV